MLVKLSAISLFLSSSVLAGPLISRAETPDFHLVAVSPKSSYNLKALNTKGTLGSGEPVKVNLEGGKLMVASSSGGKAAFIDFKKDNGGACSKHGEVVFRDTAGSSSSNKCGHLASVGLTSYNRNSQLGAKLSSNEGSFFVCNGDKVYLASSGTTLNGCFPVDLYTVPAVY